MAAPQFVSDLTIEDKDMTTLIVIARSRTGQRTEESERACF